MSITELLGALLQLLGVFVEFLLQALELRGELRIGLLPSFMQLGYLALQTIDLPLKFGLSLGSFGFPIPWGTGAVQGTGPGELHSGKPGFLLAGTQRPQVGHRPMDPLRKEPGFLGSPLEGTPVPRIPARRNPGSSLRSTPGPVPKTAPFPRENGKLPIKGTFHISEYGRVQPTPTD
ncbi:hypothetical protein F2Q69_00006796 [Brassica cretica]|uniref:Uncharacterized protein n=1 Tax=Brassica cretica TaxID=69181 RepID=A0A8S9PHD3_BRACR|nr:hypothetical protein F2Q69_00006796 [Brassica cretica]